MHRIDRCRMFPFASGDECILCGGESDEGFFLLLGLSTAHADLSAGDKLRAAQENLQYSEAQFHQRILQTYL